MQMMRLKEGGRESFQNNLYKSMYKLSLKKLQFFFFPSPAEILLQF